MESGADFQIHNKSDQEHVDQIIQLGYPQNIEYLDELLAWTADPNWPVASSIYNYLRGLGTKESARVFQLADRVDFEWRYSILLNIIFEYNDLVLQTHSNYLIKWAQTVDSEECDFEALRILSERSIVPAKEVLEIFRTNLLRYNRKIANLLREKTEGQLTDAERRKLFVWNLYIKETMIATEKAVYSFPLKEHRL